MSKIGKIRTRPHKRRSVNGWPDLVTLWALEDDGRRRDRLFAHHWVLMTVIERKSLECFRLAMDDPQTRWDVHLTAGIGYDMERLEEQFNGVFEGREDIQVIEPLYHTALTTLGDARRAVRQERDAGTLNTTLRTLLDATERLYDHIENLLSRKSRRVFIEDGLRKTTGWLRTHDDPKGHLAAQSARLRQAQRRLVHTNE